MIRELVESEGVGEEEGGVGFAEVEFDAPTLTSGGGPEGLGMRFMVRFFGGLFFGCGCGWGEEVGDGRNGGLRADDGNGGLVDQFDTDAVVV